MWQYLYLFLFFTSFLVSSILTFLSGIIAKKLNIVDIPSERKIHKVPVPLGGGFGIFFSFFLIIISGLLFVKTGFIPDFLRDYVSGIYSVIPKIISIFLAGIIVIIYGFFDDYIGLKPFQKLFSQIIVGSILFFSGIRISLLVGNIFISYFITCGWIVLMMNSFNLMDNMDGLAGGVAFITGLILFIFAFEMGQLFIATILSVFLGSVLGFLIYNFPPAKIFMGEVGSGFLGYFLGCSSILLTFYKYEESQTFLPLFAPLIIFSVPFFDTISVIIIRKKRKLPIFKADKNHLSHRLVEIGMTQKQAVLFIYLLTLTTGINALILKNLNIYGGIEVLIEVFLILGIVATLEFFGRYKNEKINSGS